MMTEDQRRRAVLFNDISNAPNEDNGPGDWVPFTGRQRLADRLWEQGWRRDVRPEDVNDPRPAAQVWARPEKRPAPGVRRPEMRLHLVVDDHGRAYIHEAVLAQLLLDAGWERTA